MPVTPSDEPPSTFAALGARAFNQQDPDPVNRPAHYHRGGMEAIDVIEAFKLGFHLGNATKYILRAGYKNDAAEDIRKAIWYLERYLHGSP